MSRTVRAGLASNSIELSHKYIIYNISYIIHNIIYNSIELSRTDLPPSSARGTATGGFTLKATSKNTFGRSTLPNRMNFRKSFKKGGGGGGSFSTQTFGMQILDLYKGL